MSPQDSDPRAESSDGGEFAVPPFLGPSRYSEADRAEVLRHLAEAGASEEEIAEAARSGTLGVLALDLALRPPGEMVSLAEASALCSLDHRKTRNGAGAPRPALHGLESVGTLCLIPAGPLGRCPRTRRSPQRCSACRLNLGRLPLVSREATRSNA